MVGFLRSVVRKTKGFFTFLIYVKNRWPKVALLSIIISLASMLYLLHNRYFIEDVGDGFRFSGCLNKASAKLDLSYDHVDVEIELQPTYDPEKHIPKIVHYLWPPRKTFTFRNYLSVRSAVLLLQPDKIIFHFTKQGQWPFCNYQTEPEPDENRYNHWWEELNLRTPNLVVKQDVDFAHNRMKEAIISILAKHGGIYINENTVITKRFSLNSKILQLPSKSTVVGYSSADNTVSLAYGQRFDSAKYDFVEGGHCSETGIPCRDINTEVFPHQFWTAEDDFSRVARLLVYGSSSKLEPLHDDKTKIPLLCHYVFVVEKTSDIEFSFFVSAISCIFVLKAKVMIHGTIKPGGPNWERLNQLAGSTFVAFIHRPLPETVFSKTVHKPSHISDVWRVEILMKHGGIYVDWDVIWVKPIDDLLNYDAVASVDVMDWKAYPDVLNLGVMLAKKNSAYLRQLKRSMFFYQENGKFPLSYFYNACLLPQKVYECHPETLKIERRLQTICNKDRCHPAWQAAYKDDNIGYNVDWRNGETYSIHWTYPVPNEFKSFDSFKGSENSTFMSKIANFVLSKVSKIS